MSKQMKNLHKQKGLSILTVACLLAFLATVAIIAVKMFPVYARNMTVRNSIEGALAGNDISTMTVAQFRREAMRSIDQANGIRDFDANDIVYVREGSNDYLDVNYEYRVDLFYNIDVIISFENRFSR